MRCADPATASRQWLGPKASQALTWRLLVMLRVRRYQSKEIRYSLSLLPLVHLAAAGLVCQNHSFVVTIMSSEATKPFHVKRK